MVSLVSRPATRPPPALLLLLLSVLACSLGCTRSIAAGGGQDPVKPEESNYPEVVRVPDQVMLGVEAIKDGVYSFRLSGTTEWVPGLSQGEAPCGLGLSGTLVRLL